ncbi:MAG: DUF2490 domain-containing protein [Candidatus Omnitrophica bacterium]|nr:DUF2490 domain-containing protein [Candidatus Omnitrophota bacterium]
MKKLFLSIPFIFLIANLAFAFDNGDFQVWNNEALSWKIRRDWKMAFEEELRFGDDGGNLYYQHSDLSIHYSGFSKWLSMGLGYRQVFEKKKGEWKEENQPNFIITLKEKIANFELSDRNRFEYREIEDSDDGWRYRNKITIGLPFEFTRQEIKPFVSDEIFVDIDKEELSQNRLYSGFSFKIIKNLNGELYYLWVDSKKSGKWIDSFVLGTKLAYSF